MAKSVQEQQAWRQEEMRFRREEEQIGLRWIWMLQLALCLFLFVTYARPASPWVTGCTVVAAVFWSVLAVRAWVFWFQHRRANHGDSGDKPDSPVAQQNDAADASRG